MGTSARGSSPRQPRMPGNPYVTSGGMGAHLARFLSIAPRIVRSLRMQAVRATFLRKRWATRSCSRSRSSDHRSSPICPAIIFLLSLWRRAEVAAWFDEVAL